MNRLCARIGQGINRGICGGQSSSLEQEMDGMAVYGYSARESDCRDREYLYEWSEMHPGSDVYVTMYILHRPCSHRQCLQGLMDCLIYESQAFRALQPNLELSK